GFFGARTSAQTFGEKRNEIAREMFDGRDYADLLPTEAQAVRGELETRGLNREPGEISQARTEGAADRERRQEMAEESFISGTLTKPLPDLWSNLNREA